MTIKAKVWTVCHKSENKPTLADFKCIEEELPPCNDGGKKKVNLSFKLLKVRGKNVLY